MIGILGGSFDPPHKGHIRLAETAMEEIGLSRVILIPTYSPPHKQLSGGASAEDRLAMTRLAAGQRNWLSVSEIELVRGGRSYSFDTVSELKRRMPEERFCFICGTDMLLTLHKWYRAEELMRLTAFAAMARGEQERELICREAERLRLLGAEIYVLRRDPMVVSSTAFRENLDSDVLAPEVYAYIREKGLYGVNKG